jgi:single-stranded DNA-binding protein
MTNRITIEGTIATVPKRRGSNIFNICEFLLDTQRAIRKDEIEYFSVPVGVFGKYGEKCFDRLEKGMKVKITGSLAWTQYSPVRIHQGYYIETVKIEILGLRKV